MKYDVIIVGEGSAGAVWSHGCQKIYSTVYDAPLVIVERMSRSRMAVDDTTSTLP